jgi:hypothetical protein
MRMVREAFASSPGGDWVPWPVDFRPGGRGEAPFRPGRAHDQISLSGWHQISARARLSRLRTGATDWGLYQDGQNPRLFIELFGVPSWEEHLRQHRERQTGTDLEYHAAAAALSNSPPQTDHYLAAAVHD